MIKSNYFKNINSYNRFIKNLNKCCLNIISVNIRRVSSICKFNKFKYKLSKISRLPDIIAIQETWFNKQYLNLYTIPGYQVIHC